MQDDNTRASETAPASTDGERAHGRGPPPDHLQLGDIPWALFAASFAHVGANRGLRRLMARSGEALRRAGVSPPALLGPQHDVSAFDCGVAQLNEALQSIAQRPAASHKTQVFVIAAGRRVVGYYTARPGSVARTGGAPSECIPVVHIRRFAVDRRWANSEFASDLLWHLVRHAYAAAGESSERALFGYAISPPVKRLYLSRGARPLPKPVHRRATMITFADVADALRDPKRVSQGHWPDRRLLRDDRVVRSDRFVGTEAARQFYLVDLDRGDCIGLNKVGARIWALIGAPVRVADICAKLQSEFDVDPAACERDVLALLDDMRRERMILVASPEAAAVPPHASFSP